VIFEVELYALFMPFLFLKKIILNHTLLITWKTL
ncbi:MAG: hypothetical protein ACI86P_002669, partial [Flavobacteriales bacterium]